MRRASSRPAPPATDRSGETAIAGKNVSVVPLTWLPRSPWLTWLILPFWLGRNGFALVREISRADAVFALHSISDRSHRHWYWRSLCASHCSHGQLNNWSEPRFLWQLERALLERIAGGRNVVFATGDFDEPPSRRNPRDPLDLQHDHVRTAARRPTQSRVTARPKDAPALSSLE